MIDSKLELKTPEEAETVYYQAFMHCDVKVMAALWADGDVVCIHPGSGVIEGYDAVLRSWNHILTNAQSPQINYAVLRQSVSDDLVVHLVAEEIVTEGEASALVLATNVYQKFNSGWLMVEHHASLVQQSRPQNQTIQ